MTAHCQAELDKALSNAFRQAQDDIEMTKG